MTESHLERFNFSVEFEKYLIGDVCTNYNETFEEWYKVFENCSEKQSCVTLYKEHNNETKEAKERKKNMKKHFTNRYNAEVHRLQLRGQLPQSEWDRHLKDWTYFEKSALRDEVHEFNNGVDIAPTIAKNLNRTFEQDFTPDQVQLAIDHLDWHVSGTQSKSYGKWTEEEKQVVCEVLESRRDAAYGLLVDEIKERISKLHTGKEQESGEEPEELNSATIDLGISKLIEEGRISVVPRPGQAEDP